MANPKAAHVDQRSNPGLERIEAFLRECASSVCHLEKKKKTAIFLFLLFFFMMFLYVGQSFFDSDEGDIFVQGYTIAHGQLLYT